MADTAEKVRLQVVLDAYASPVIAPLRELRDGIARGEVTLDGSRILDVLAEIDKAANAAALKAFDATTQEGQSPKEALLAGLQARYPEKAPDIDAARRLLDDAIGDRNFDLGRFREALAGVMAAEAQDREAGFEALRNWLSKREITHKIAGLPEDKETLSALNEALDLARGVGIPREAFLEGVREHHAKRMAPGESLAAVLQDYVRTGREELQKHAENASGAAYDVFMLSAQESIRPETVRHDLAEERGRTATRLKELQGRDPHDSYQAISGYLKIKRDVLNGYVQRRLDTEPLGPLFRFTHKPLSDHVNGIGAWPEPTPEDAANFAIIENVRRLEAGQNDRPIPEGRPRSVAVITSAMNAELQKAGVQAGMAAGFAGQLEKYLEDRFANIGNGKFGVESTDIEAIAGLVAPAVKAKGIDHTVLDTATSLIAASAHFKRSRNVPDLLSRLGKTPSRHMQSNEPPAALDGDNPTQETGWMLGGLFVGSTIAGIGQGLMRKQEVAEEKVGEDGKPTVVFHTRRSPIRTLLGATTVLAGLALILDGCTGGNYLMKPGFQKVMDLVRNFGRGQGPAQSF